VVHRPGNVEYDDALEVGQRNSPSVTLELDTLVQVAVSPGDDLAAAEHAEPDEVLGAAATLLRVRLALLVELQRDLGVQPDAEVVVHHAALVIVLARAATNHLHCYSHSEDSSPALLAFSASTLFAG